MKRHISILLIVGVMFSLAACGSSFSDKEEVAASITAASADNEHPVEEKTVAADSQYRDLEVGDTLKFGVYQDTEIEWTVLDKDADGVMLISSYILDNIPYRDSYDESGWEKCSLRSWLNDYFYKFSFTPEERSQIRLSKVCNDNDGYSNTTEDKVYLLSEEEALRYLPEESDRVMAGTEWAMKFGNLRYWDNLPGKPSYWRLRRTGAPDVGITYVTISGEIHNNTGAYDDGDLGGIVPVIWLDYKQTEKPAEISIDTDVPNPSYKPGDRISFGSYLDEAIEWLVLENDEDSLTLLSTKALDQQSYEGVRSEITWEQCSLRKWLNTTFYNKAFNDEEKRYILETQNQNPDNSEFGTDGGNDTNDRVYLLNEYETRKYVFEDKLISGTDLIGFEGWLRGPSDGQGCALYTAYYDWKNEWDMPRWGEGIRQRLDIHPVIRVGFTNDKSVTHEYDESTEEISEDVGLISWDEYQQPESAEWFTERLNDPSIFLQTLYRWDGNVNEADGYVYTYYDYYSVDTPVCTVDPQNYIAVNEEARNKRKAGLVFHIDDFLREFGIEENDIIHDGSKLTLGDPTVEGCYLVIDTFNRCYSYTPDGKRFYSYYWYLNEINTGISSADIIRYKDAGLNGTYEMQYYYLENGIRAWQNRLNGNPWKK